MTEQNVDFFAMQAEISNHFEEHCKEVRAKALKDKKQKQVKLAMEFGQYQAMVLAGLITQRDMESCLKWGTSFSDKECKPGDKIKLEKLFGKCTVASKPYDIASVEKNTGKFEVSFDSGKYVGMRWYQVIELPEDAPCKIEEHYQPAYKTHSLSCKVPQ